MTTVKTKSKTRTPRQVLAEAYGDSRGPKPGEVEQFQRDCRIIGSVVGLCCGDGAGAPWEFRRPPLPGQARFGTGTFGHKPGQGTDDSEMALAIVKARSVPEKVAAGFMTWFRSPTTKDVGAQTARVLGRARTYEGMVASAAAFAKDAARVRMPLPGSGNGALMRTGPVCLPFLGDRAKVAKVARQIASLTHADPFDGDGAVLWSLLIESALTREGEAFDLGKAVQDALEFIPEDRRKVWAALAELSMAPRVRAQVFSRNGSGFAALSASLSAVSHASSYEQAVQDVIQFGDDTDTTGAITGALAGAIWGCLPPDGIPGKWWSKVWAICPGDGPVDAAGMARMALDAAGDARVRRAS
jgi:ADP-ribosyl-[dinitrogen reductase] hydrolase